MDTADRQALARDRANRYAPMPSGGSWMAGVCVAVVALVGDVAVSGFYGWSVRDHLLLAAGLTAAGFVAGFLGYKNLKRLNRRATRNERARIDADLDGAP